MLNKNLLHVENAPVAFNTTILFEFPLFVGKLKEEVTGASSVGFANEGIQEGLETFNGSNTSSVGRMLDIGRFLKRDHQTKPTKNRQNHALWASQSRQYTSLACWEGGRHGQRWSP